MSIINKLFSLFKKPVQQIPVEVKPIPVEVVPIVVNLKDYLTASGKYPERENHKEVTDEVKANTEELLKRVNALLQNINIIKVNVASGFRPSDVNANIANAAKKSLHMSGEAIDLEDKLGELDRLIGNHPNLLTKHGLWLEHPEATPGWCHLDISKKRTDRPIRIFKP